MFKKKSATVCNMDAINDCTKFRYEQIMNQYLQQIKTKIIILCTVHCLKVIHKHKHRIFHGY